ncbi:Lipid A core - O-antigen ligase and related enzymes [Serratia rubidaea]|uniref:Lipid A core - O-antigen ligase and related enzymes n=1 Tax=Serratia rubidaea TaxID=61652 RepID=A0A447QMN0_SERRU|nr:Lipid A core - O-antigen ligase and related enzymes [Serratia rubidaea]
MALKPQRGVFSAGVALLSVPLTYAPPDGYAPAAWRVSALLAGWLWYCGWLQVRLAFRWRTALIALLLALAAGQSLIALLQLFWPAWSWVPLRGTRVFGIFQQPNVLGSFIATGLALALMLAVLPGYVLRAARAERARQAGWRRCWRCWPPCWCGCSRAPAGWGRAGAGGVLAGVPPRLRPRLQRAALAVLLGGAFATALLLWLGETGEVRYVSHALSNQARLAMLQDTLKMIAVKPWLGWGYGQFEYAFQHFRIAQQSPTPVLEIAGHPHNEILLWWLEGGLVALAGIVLLLLGECIYCGRRCALTAAPSPAAAATPARRRRCVWRCCRCCCTASWSIRFTSRPCTGCCLCCCWRSWTA